MSEGDLWVFGYGSLMWRPGFPYLDVQPAVLEGYHRAFCLYSRHYRGTAEKPGLVLGLTPGGHCQGAAFRVAADKADEVVDYLNERELGSYAYIALTLPVCLCRSGERVEAYTFVADPQHRQYAGNLGLERSAQIIMDAEGRAGLNRDYLINTVRELENHGVVDSHLHELLLEVERQTGLIEAGGGI
ncbi:gamma-glutamylcyclotransferase [Telmatospirillum sp. J64-1]|uniref:gamma-glutamylcyclotransferase n=1 Tax=Telmatospirillum sp. J64-1 TaxID=2502183 RepID=UPI00115DEB41|nr:gamma-glutamylcyclotransferase [Telmatospirillum sp. J64-1]